MNQDSSGPEYSIRLFQLYHESGHSLDISVCKLKPLLVALHWHMKVVMCLKSNGAYDSQLCTII